MSPKIIEFIKNHKEEINNLDFALLHEKLKSHYFHDEIKDFWQAIKKVYPKISYDKIIPRYEEYIDFNGVEIATKDLKELNDQVTINLPDMTFHEILRVVMELYPNSLDKNRVKMLLQKPDALCHNIKLNIIPPWENSAFRCNVALTYTRIGSPLKLNIPLEIVSKLLLNGVPGLCIAYKLPQIQKQLKENELDILDTLEEIRKG